MLCITRSRAYGHVFQTDANSVNNGHEKINMVSNCSEKDKEYPVKNTGSGIIFRLAATNENAQKCVFCAIFMKCLKWPETYPKWIWGDLEHFDICARTYAYARVYWPEIDRTDIDLDHGKYEWEMTFSYEVMIIRVFFFKTKWRLDDVTITPWPWKGCGNLIL